MFKSTEKVIEIVAQNSFFLFYIMYSFTKWK